MKTLYLECSMGAAGDMLMAALFELIEEKDSFVEKMNHLGIPGVSVKMESSEKCGILGTHASVIIDGEEEESEDVHHQGHSHGAVSYTHLTPAWNSCGGFVWKKDGILLGSSQNFNGWIFTLKGKGDRILL